MYLFAVFVTCIQIAGAQNSVVKPSEPAANPWALPKTMVDRSVLSVEKKVYALSDVYAIIALWKTAYPEDKFPQVSDWAEGSGYQFDRTRSFLRQFEKWPTDVQRTLFVVLSWPESSQRGALTPTDEDLKNLISKVQSPQVLSALEPNLSQAIRILPQAALQERANQVLRALSLRKTQSGLSETAGSRQWFWHQRVSGGEPSNK
jgi:hypothetical protein